VNLVELGIFTAVMPKVIGSTLSVVDSGRSSIAAATWFSEISVIIFEVDIVAEWKQTNW